MLLYAVYWLRASLRDTDRPPPCLPFSPSSSQPLRGSLHGWEREPMVTVKGGRPNACFFTLVE